jgi:transposase
MSGDRRRYLAYEVLRLRRRGRSLREIATALSISRRTVRRLLDEARQRREEGESAARREIPVPVPRGSSLDQHQERIKEWIEEFGRKLTAVRCLEMLKQHGFTGSYTIVRQRLKKLRLELIPPRPTATEVVTAPGQRGEFDWSPYKLDGRIRVELFHVVLRWSRTPALFAAQDTLQTTTFRFLRQAFEEWGGVPEEMLTDSMPGVVDRWELDQPVLNLRYIDFAAHYGFTALIAPRRCPKWKAVCERRFRHHEENLLSGRNLRSFAEYLEVLAWWKREKVLKRPHPETGRPIAEMFELERSELQPLPGHPYDTRDVCVRLVDDYQRTRFETNHYPVPAPVGSLVYLLADVDRIEISDPQARRLIVHQRLPAGARRKLPAINAKRVRYDLDELEERVGRWGEVAAAFAAGVRAKRRYAGPELVRLLSLVAHWSADDIVAALSHAMAYGCYEVIRVTRILELRYTPRTFEDRIAESTRRRIREVMKDHPVSGRPLDSWASLETGDRTRKGDRDDQEEE